MSPRGVLDVPPWIIFHDLTPIIVKKENIKEKESTQEKEVHVSENLFGALAKVQETQDIKQPEDTPNLEPIKQPKNQLKIEVGKPGENLNAPDVLVKAVSDFLDARGKTKTKKSKGMQMEVIIEKLRNGMKLEGQHIRMISLDECLEAVNLCIENNWQGIQWGMKTVQENRQAKPGTSQNINGKYQKFTLDDGRIKK